MKSESEEGRPYLHREVYPAAPGRAQPQKVDQLGDVGIRRRKEIRALPEFRVALRAQPVAAVGVADAVLRICFVLRLEQFPAANETAIFFPTAFYEFKVFGILRQAQVKRNFPGFSFDRNVEVRPGTSVPMPVIHTAVLDRLADVFGVPADAVDFDGSAETESLARPHEIAMKRCRLLARGFSELKAHAGGVSSTVAQKLCCKAGSFIE